VAGTSGHEETHEVSYGQRGESWREGQGWRSMDEVGKFREEERDSKDEQGGLKS
jgi:hypothetical protein